MKSKCVKRGEIYYISPSPVVGHEQAGKRPAIIISNDLGNVFSPVVEIVFTTTKCKKTLPTHVVIDSSERRSVVLCEQVTTIDKSRILNYIGKVTEEEMKEINQAIKISLGMEENKLKKEIVKINNFDVTVKMYKGQRVVTFKDIDMVHERVEGTAKRNFRENRQRFIMGEDFFVVCADEIRTNKIMEISDKAHQDVFLLTESGYLMLVKSFTDDLAWNVQRKLVKSYFIKNDKYEDMSTELKAVLVVDKRISKAETRIEKLENTMNIDYGQQQELKKAVNSTVINVLGGKLSNAYKEISKKVFSECNRDIQDYFKVNSRNNIPRIKYYEAIDYVNTWQPCNNTKIAIKDCNNQLNIV